MPYKDPERRRENQRQYYVRNRESKHEYYVRNRERIREYRQDRRQYSAEIQREYRVQNRERIIEREREYYQRNHGYRRSQVGRCRQQLIEGIPTPRNRTPWTSDEDAIAERSDINLIEMCYMLGRSYGAIARRRQIIKRNFRSTQS